VGELRGRTAWENCVGELRRRTASENCVGERRYRIALQNCVTEPRHPISHDFLPRFSPTVFSHGFLPRFSPTVFSHDFDAVERATLFIQSVLTDLVQQRARRQLQEIRGAGLVAAGPLEGLLDEAPLENGGVLLDRQLVVRQIR
jgi:hypothetical protein